MCGVWGFGHGCYCVLSLVPWFKTQNTFFFCKDAPTLGRRLHALNELKEVLRQAARPPLPPLGNPFGNPLGSRLSAGGGGGGGGDQDGAGWRDPAAALARRLCQSNVLGKLLSPDVLHAELLSRHTGTLVEFLSACGALDASHLVALWRVASPTFAVAQQAPKALNGATAGDFDGELDSGGPSGPSGPSGGGMGRTVHESLRHGALKVLGAVVSGPWPLRPKLLGLLGRLLEGLPSGSLDAPTLDLAALVAAANEKRLVLSDQGPEANLLPPSLGLAVLWREACDEDPPVWPSNPAPPPAPEQVPPQRCAPSAPAPASAPAVAAAAPGRPPTPCPSQTRPSPSPPPWPPRAQPAHALSLLVAGAGKGRALGGGSVASDAPRAWLLGAACAALAARASTVQSLKVLRALLATLAAEAAAEAVASAASAVSAPATSLAAPGFAESRAAPVKLDLKLLAAQDAIGNFLGAASGPAPEAGAGTGTGAGAGGQTAAQLGALAMSMLAATAQAQSKAGLGTPGRKALRLGSGPPPTQEQQQEQQEQPMETDRPAPPPSPRGHAEFSAETAGPQPAETADAQVAASAPAGPLALALAAALFKSGRGGRGGGHGGGLATPTPRLGQTNVKVAPLDTPDGKAARVGGAAGEANSGGTPVPTELLDFFGSGAAAAAVGGPSVQGAPGTAATKPSSASASAPAPASAGPKERARRAAVAAVGPLVAPALEAFKAAALPAADALHLRAQAQPQAQTQAQTQENGGGGKGVDVAEAVLVGRFFGHLESCRAWVAFLAAAADAGAFQMDETGLTLVW